MRPFPTPLIDATLVRRYKRFLADVRTDDGKTLTVHCANPGAMTGMAAPGSPVLLSDSHDPKRKLRYSWELVKAGRSWVGVNTQIGNRVVAHWLATNQLLADTDAPPAPLQREVRIGNHRFDFARGDTIIEVKTVTLKQGKYAAFPDAVTKRGRKHVESLARMKNRRRVLLFFVARGDVTLVRPADEIDPAYGKALRKAKKQGLEIVAVRAHLGRDGVRKGPLLDVVL